MHYVLDLKVGELVVALRLALDLLGKLVENQRAAIEPFVQTHIGTVPHLQQRCDRLVRLTKPIDFGLRKELIILEGRGPGACVPRVLLKHRLHLY